MEGWVCGDGKSGYYILTFTERERWRKEALEECDALIKMAEDVEWIIIVSCCTHPHSPCTLHAPINVHVCVSFSDWRWHACMHMHLSTGNVCSSYLLAYSTAVPSVVGTVIIKTDRRTIDDLKWIYHQSSSLTTLVGARFVRTHRKCGRNLVDLFPLLNRGRSSCPDVISGIR